MNLFYSTLIDGNTITIKGQEARHCSKVLRKTRGDKIMIIDGEGGRYECEILNISKDEIETVVRGTNIIDENPNLVHIGVGMIKSSSRMEWMIEKLVELGIRQFTPLICQRSERQKINVDRFRKIAISATKQSMGYFVPIIDEPVHFSKFIKTNSSKFKYIAAYGNDTPELVDISKLRDKTTLLIGPEGDFTDEEIHLSEQSHYHRVLLGHRRLRTETAAIVATTILNLNKN